MSHLSTYIGIFLDTNSQGLLGKLRTFVPKDWIWYGDHMTIKFFGTPTYPEDFPEPYNELAMEQKPVSLVVSHIGISDNAIAVKVEGYPVEGQMAHITLAIPDGGSPKQAKNITNWKKIKSFTLHGKIMGNGDAGEKVIGEEDVTSDTLVPFTGERRGELDGKDYLETVWAAPTMHVNYAGTMAEGFLKNVTKEVLYEVFQDNITLNRNQRGWFKPNGDFIPIYAHLDFLVKEYGNIVGDLIAQYNTNGEMSDEVIEALYKEAKKDGFVRLDYTIVGGVPTLSLEGANKDKVLNVLREHYLDYLNHVDKSVVYLDIGHYSYNFHLPSDTRKLNQFMNGVLTEDNMRELTGEHVGWVTPDDKFIGVDDHIDYLWRNYGAEIDAMKQAGIFSDFNQKLYELAFNQGLVRTYLQIFPDYFEAAIEGKSRERVKEILGQYFYPILANKRGRVAADVLNPAEHFLFTLPQDKEEFAQFVFGTTAEGVIKKLVVENLLQHTKDELKRAGLFDKDADYGGMIGKAVMELMKVFEKQGHSGFSAGWVASLFKKLAGFETLTPISSDPDEWNEVTEMMGGKKRVWQNKRNPAYFSNNGGKKWYNVDDKTVKEGIVAGVYGYAAENGTLLTEITTTFPFNVNGAEATYDSWTDHAGDANKPINEIEYTDITKLPFLSAIEKVGGKVYQVGGAVRDSFLGKTSKDLDIMVSGLTVEQLMKALAPFGRANMVGQSFGVIKFKPQGAMEDIDIALARTDKKVGTGHKGIEVFTDPSIGVEQDLERRDFTINAIAKDIHGNIIDPFGGTKDLQNKVIKMVSPTAFAEDPLRMLRAVQFAARFNFTIDPQTFRVIQEHADDIKTITAERISEEFNKMIHKGHPEVAAKLLVESGLYKGIFGADFKGTYDEFPKVKRMSEFIYLLTKDSLPSPSDFFKKTLKGDIDTFKEIKVFELPATTDWASERWMLNKAQSIAPDAIGSFIVQDKVKDVSKHPEEKYPRVASKLAVSGDEIKALGIKDQFHGNLNRDLLDLIYSDKLENNRDAIMQYIQQNIDKYKPNTPQKLKEITTSLLSENNIVRVYRGTAGDEHSTLLYFTPNRKYAEWFQKESNGKMMVVDLDTTNFIDLRGLGLNTTFAKVMQVLKKHGVKDNLEELLDFFKPDTPWATWQIAPYMLESLPNVTGFIIRETNKQTPQLGAVDAYVTHKRTLYEHKLLYETENKDTNTLIIPKGHKLFHGTGEPFEGELRGGGYDNILWTTEQSAISQAYIFSGGKMYLSTDSIAYPSEDKQIQNIQREFGIDYDYTDIKFNGHRASSYKIAPVFMQFHKDYEPTHQKAMALWNQMRTPEFNQLPASEQANIADEYDKLVKAEYAIKPEKKMREYVNQKLTQLGYEPIGYTGGDDKQWKIKMNSQNIVPADYRSQGRLFIVTPKRDMKIFDATHGGSRDADMTEPDYHRFDWFNAAEKGGYDGIKITDLAQSEDMGNFGHDSIGFFPSAMKDLEYHSIQASHNPLHQHYMSGDYASPEYKQFSQQQLQEITKTVLSSANTYYRAEDTNMGNEVTLEPSGYYEAIDKDNNPIMRYDTFWESDTPEIAAAKTISGAVLGAFSMRHKSGQYYIYAINDKPEADISHWTYGDFSYIQEVRFRHPVRAKLIKTITVTDEQAKVLEDYYTVLDAGLNQDYEALENAKFDENAFESFLASLDGKTTINEIAMQSEKVWYHNTPVKNVASILKNGLLPNARHEGKTKDSHYEAVRRVYGSQMPVFLTSNKALFHHFADATFIVDINGLNYVPDIPTFEDWLFNSNVEFKRTGDGYQFDEEMVPEEMWDLPAFISYKDLLTNKKVIDTIVGFTECVAITDPIPPDRIKLQDGVKTNAEIINENTIFEVKEAEKRGAWFIPDNSPQGGHLVNTSYHSKYAMNYFNMVDPEAAFYKALGMGWVRIVYPSYDESWAFNSTNKENIAKAMKLLRTQILYSPSRDSVYVDYNGGASSSDWEVFQKRSPEFLEKFNLMESREMPERWEYWADDDNLPADLKDRVSVGKRPNRIQEAEIEGSKVLLGQDPYGTPVYTVNGELVRQYCYPDFSLGGNDMAYPNFVPKNEIWVDQDLRGGNRETTINHESLERHEMFKQHKFYDVGSGKGEHGAHVDALGREHEIRAGEAQPIQLTEQIINESHGAWYIPKDGSYEIVPTEDHTTTAMEILGGEYLNAFPRAMKAGWVRITYPTAQYNTWTFNGIHPENVKKAVQSQKREILRSGNAPVWVDDTLDHSSGSGKWKYYKANDFDFQYDYGLINERSFTKEKLQQLVMEAKGKQLRRLVIFDMDSTLIDSPEPEMGREQWKEKTGEDYPHKKAWWSTPESLNPDVFDIKTIAPVFNQMRDEQRRGDTMVVIMTNRLDTLHKEVRRILKMNRINPDMLSMAEYAMQNKGERVLQILKQNPTINYVAFYDDQTKNLEDVKLALRKKGITYDLYNCEDGKIRRI